MSFGFFVGTAITIASTPKCQAQEVYGIATLKSYHEDRSHGYNEHNLGVGLQLQVHEDLAFMAGEYKNSFFHQSNYIGIMYTPFHRDNWSMGGLLGDVTGYDPDNLKRPQWAAVPLVVYKQDGWLVNVPFVPPLRKQGIVAVQVGLKF